MCSDRGDYEHFLNFGEIFRDDPCFSNNHDGDGVLYLKRLDCLESVKYLKKHGRLHSVRDAGGRAAIAGD
jgi:hypothetical protein